MISRINLIIMKRRINKIEIPKFKPGTTVRQRLKFYGKVKRVAFRNEVFLLAKRLGVSGVVYNDKKRVVVEVQGIKPQIDFLVNHLKEVKRFSITTIAAKTLKLNNDQTFRKIRRPKNGNQ